MTDNEIIKEFDLFLKYSAPEKLLNDVLDLINRQKAEIEEYKEANKRWSDALNNANEENTELQHRINELQHEIKSCNSKTIESHGKWLPDYETFVDENGYESEPIQTGFFCSACGALGCKEDSYCACCGTKMDKEGDNDED